MLKQRFCSAQEIAVYLAVPIKTIYSWASEGVLPSIKIRKRVLFDIFDVDQFMLEKKRNRPDPMEVADKIINDFIDEV